MIAVPGDLLNRNYWITKELVSVIKQMGKNTVSTLKQKVSNSKGDLVMYKPTGIYKTLKEE